MGLAERIQEKIDSGKSSQYIEERYLSRAKKETLTPIQEEIKNFPDIWLDFLSEISKFPKSLVFLYPNFHISLLSSIKFFVNGGTIDEFASRVGIFAKNENPRKLLKKVRNYLEELWDKKVPQITQSRQANVEYTKFSSEIKPFTDGFTFYIPEGRSRLMKSAEKRDEILELNKTDSKITFFEEGKFFILPIPVLLERFIKNGYVSRKEHSLTDSNKVIQIVNEIAIHDFLKLPVNLFYYVEKDEIFNPDHIFSNVLKIERGLKYKFLLTFGTFTDLNWKTRGIRFVREPLTVASKKSEDFYLLRGSKIVFDKEKAEKIVSLLKDYRQLRNFYSALFSIVSAFLQNY